MSDIKVLNIDHVSLPVAAGADGKDDGPLKVSIAFYSGILGLEQIGRPKDLVDELKLGAWFKVGESGQTLHLIANEKLQSTFRKAGLSSRDIHFAVRIGSFIDTLRFLVSQEYWLEGYRPEAEGGPGDGLALKEMRVHLIGKAGFPQIFIMDPDRNVVELNLGQLLSPDESTLVNNELDKLKKRQLKG